MARFQSEGAEFLSKSHQEQPKPSPEKRGEPQPDYTWPIRDQGSLISLPDPAPFFPGNNNFKAVLENRKSLRQYDTSTDLSLAELGYLLWLTQGIKHISEKRGVTVRTVPSAGSRHPFETLLAVKRVEGLDPAIYHYVPQQHALEVFLPGEEPLARMDEACYRQQQVVNSAVTFIWAAEPYRTTWRYANRGYRYLFIDAGHVCQNLYLAAESIDCGVCAIGAYNDTMADEVLGFDGQERFTIYMASVGRKSPKG